MNLRRRETIKVQINGDESGTPLSCSSTVDIELSVDDVTTSQIVINMIEIITDNKMT